LTRLRQLPYTYFGSCLTLRHMGRMSVAEQRYIPGLAVIDEGELWVRAPHAFGWCATLG